MCQRSLIVLSMRLYCLFSIVTIQPAFAQDPQPFYKNGTYDSTIPTPAEIMGHEIGERPSRHAEILDYFRVLAEISPRMQLVISGKTHEGRTLIYALISAEGNQNKIDTIKENIGKLADPRQLRSGAVTDIVQNTPAVAWMMYSIHGDELSGADAAVQLAYQLTAGTDAQTQKLLENLVIGIDPMENPDGRDRYLAMMQQWNGNIPNPDVQSIQHAGAWPWGRTNHYLFDLNRDWFILSQPESRARVSALTDWHPQLVIDAHEMGAFSSFLFPPARKPVNQNYQHRLLKWIEKFAADDAKAFDAYGWSYYTREWLEEWYPGYGSSLPMLRGAVAILYEQASTDGTLIKRPDGTILTFREAVHHQFISSLANLTTLAENRETLLREFYEFKKAAISGKKSGVQAYFIVPGKNPSRVNRMIERLQMQGVEIEIADAEFSVNSAKNYWEKAAKSHKLPKGTYMIRTNQPLRHLINAVMEFDPRMSTEFLKWERETIEKGKEATKLYEVSAWSLPMAYDVEAYASNTAAPVKTSPVKTIPKSAGQLINAEARYGYLIDFRDDNAVHALLKLLKKGYNVRLKQEASTIKSQVFPRGSLLIRKHENPATLTDDLQQISTETGTKIYGINTSLAEKGSDLGGDENYLLTEPRIALLAGPNLSAYNVGAMWYLLDYELGMRFSIIPNANINRADLRKYNVLILPSTRGGQETYGRIFGKNGIKKLKTWVSNGGTLIGIGNASAFLADSASKMSQVRLKRQSLKMLDKYQNALENEWQTGKYVIDSLAMWEGESQAPVSETMTKTKTDTSKLAELDKRQRSFQPRGAFLNLTLDTEHWLTAGMGAQVPALLYSSYAYLSKKPVETVGRFSDAHNLRLSGLLWPEARERWQKTAYLTRESLGSGQIILFADEPNFRSYTYGTARLLINAMLLGPGCGTHQSVPW